MLLLWRICRSTPSRPNNIWGGLKCPSVRPSVHKLFPISMKFGVYIEVDKRCRTVCRMTRSKVKVTGFWSSENCTFLSLSPPFTEGAGKWPLILTLRFFIFVLFLCHVTLNLEGSLRLVRPQKVFSDFSDIWYVDRGRWVMHDGMPYEPDARSRSRSRLLESHSREVNRQSHTGPMFELETVSIAEPLQNRQHAQNP